MLRSCAKFVVSLAALVALASSPTRATVYNVDDVFGGSSIIGTITTSGMSSDIIAWDLAVKVGAFPSVVLTQLDSVDTIIGGPLTATASELEFPTTRGVHSLDFNDFPAHSFFDIFVDIDIPILGSVGGSTWDAHNHLAGAPNRSVNPLIAQTPLPAALPLFATALGAMGLLGWRRKRRAIAA
jgi:hypothetical protein